VSLIPNEPLDSSLMLRGSPPPAAPPKSPRRIAWDRRRRSLRESWNTFRENKIGIAGLVMLCIFIAIAVCAPLIVPHKQTEITSGSSINKLMPPLREAIPSTCHEVSQEGGSTKIACDTKFSMRYPMGTDGFGRSIFAQWVWGARISLLIGLTATVIAMAVGAVVGISGGFFGGHTDTFMNGITNWFLVIPWIALAIAMASVLGPSLLNIILVIAITSWASSARLVRSQTLSVRNRNYVERARALGASNWHIITRDILPNVFPIIFANTILLVALAILSETTLSIIGLGDPTRVSWGQMLERGFNAGASSLGAWWWLFFPGAGITLTVLGFAMCGYALDEILNPRLRKR